MRWVGGNAVERNRTMPVRITCTVNTWRVSGREDGFNRGTCSECRIQTAAMQKALRGESQPGCTCICRIVYVVSSER